MSYLQAFDGAGARIEGQQGNRTPTVVRVQPRQQLRQGQFVNDDASGFPAVPDLARRRLTPVVTMSLAANRIGRYYQTFPDFVNTVTDPTDHGRRWPYGTPASSVANRIQRYYSPQIINPLPDAPIDRVRPQAFIFSSSSIPNRISRYYQAFDVSVPFVPPIVVDTSGGGGQIFNYRRPLIDDDDVALILALLN